MKSEGKNATLWVHAVPCSLSPVPYPLSPHAPDDEERIHKQTPYPYRGLPQGQSHLATYIPLTM